MYANPGYHQKEFSRKTPAVSKCFYWPYGVCGVLLASICTALHAQNQLKPLFWGTIEFFLYTHIYGLKRVIEGFHLAQNPYWCFEVSEGW